MSQAEFGSRSLGRNPGFTIAIAVLAVIAAAYFYVLNLDPQQQKALLWAIQDYLPIVMFLTLATLLFTGFPVAFILGGLAFLFGMIGYLLGVFSLIEFFNFMPRVWFGGAADGLSAEYTATKIR